MLVSVIVPTLNEESVIEGTLSSLPREESLEIVVVDGGSLDRTVELVRELPVTLVRSARGRARQMNAGAQAAKGDVFLFLHADCRLGRGWLQALRVAMEDGFAGGCFTQRIDSPRRIYRLIEWMGNTRARKTGIYFGDQAIFSRRGIFFDLNGYDEVEIFEDVMFSRKLSRCGKTGVLPPKLMVSPRRWEERGIVRTTLLFWFLTIGYMLGVSTRRLKGFFDDVR
jgi:rSAM/selenodomain-associated transferase 2